MAVAVAGPSEVKGPKTTEAWLSEIESGNAAQAVLGIRDTTAPPGPTFVPSLDRILGEARPHPGGSTLRRGDLVELVGSSGSGKTTFIIFLLLTHVLPTSITIPLPPPHSQPVTISLGGKAEQATLLHPPSHRSPVPALVHAMRAHIENCVKAVLKDNLRPQIITSDITTCIDDAIESSLGRLHVIRPKPRWKQWLLALQTILHPPSLHLDPSSWDEKDHGMSLVVCDGFGDGFWPERWIEEERRGKRKVGVDGIRGGEDVGMRDVIEVIERIRRDLRSIVVLSTQGFWSSGTTALFSPHLPSPYPAPYAPPRQTNNENPIIHIDQTHKPLDIQLTLIGRVRPLQHPAETTLVDVLRTLQVVDEKRDVQRFEGIARVPGGEGLAGTMGGVKFSWAVGPEGMEVWDE